MSAIVIATATILLSLTGIAFLLAGAAPLVLGMRRGQIGHDQDLVVMLAGVFLILDVVAASVGGALLWVGGL